MSEKMTREQTCFVCGAWPEEPCPRRSCEYVPQAEIDKGETVWGLGDVDRGFQNMGIEIARLRAHATRQREEIERLRDEVQQERSDTCQLLVRATKAEAEARESAMDAETNYVQGIKRGIVYTFKYLNWQAPTLNRIEEMANAAIAKEPS